MLNLKVLYILVTLCFSLVISANNLYELFTWTRLDYDWSGLYQNSKQIVDSYGYFSLNQDFGSYQYFHRYHPSTLIPNNVNEDRIMPHYIYQNNIPMGVAIWKDKMFITVPRRSYGIPSTLNYVNLNGVTRHNVPLIPYPNWEMNLFEENATDSSSTLFNRVPNDRIVSAYRIAVDNYDRLWVADTGKMEYRNLSTTIQPSKLIIFDLNTDTVLRQHVFPENVVRPNSSLTHISVENDRRDPNNVYAYISDLMGYGIIVYSFREDRSWRVSHEYFLPNPAFAELNIAGFTFEWNDGVFSSSVSRRNQDGTKDLYFNALASSHIYRVSTETLKNDALFSGFNNEQDFQDMGDRGRNSQTSVSAIHQPSDVLFLGLVNQNALACWNVNSPLSDISIVQQHDEKMIYPCDMKVYNDDVYLLTNNMPRFVYGKLDYDTINFRIWTQNVRQAIQGTRC